MVMEWSWRGDLSEQSAVFSAARFMRVDYQNNYQSAQIRANRTFDNFHRSLGNKTRRSGLNCLLFCFLVIIFFLSKRGSRIMAFAGAPTALETELVLPPIENYLRGGVRRWNKGTTAPLSKLSISQKSLYLPGATTLIYISQKLFLVKKYLENEQKSISHLDARCSQGRNF